MNWKEDILIVIIIIALVTGGYVLGRFISNSDYKYYKEKSEKEQRLLWRIQYTYPEQWELIKNTPEYYPCKQYNIEDINEY